MGEYNLARRHVDSIEWEQRSYEFHDKAALSRRFCDTQLPVSYLKNWVLMQKCPDGADTSGAFLFHVVWCTEF